MNKRALIKRFGEILKLKQLQVLYKVEDMKKSDKTKILYIGPIPPEVGGQASGGVATYTWELATQAHRKGYDVHILANTASSFVRDGIRIISLPPRNKLLKALYGLRFLLTANKNRMVFLNFLSFKRARALYSAYSLKKTIERVKPDLIHIQSLTDTHALILTFLKNCPPTVITDHGIGVYFMHANVARKIFGIKKMSQLEETVKETVKTANFIITVSDFAKQQLKEQINLPSSLKIKAVLNPLDVNKFPLLSKKETKEELGLVGKKVVFFSGVHEPIKKKGLDILLQAFGADDYLQKNCKLLVVTRGQGISFARGFLKDKNIDGLILDPQPREKLVKYYNAADVFVMPSRIEGIGLVYEESLAVGTPIVGFPDSLEELEELLGIYIGEKFDASKEDEKALAKKIIKVLNTDFDRKLLRKKVVENLSWNARFGEFDSIYRELLADT